MPPRPEPPGPEPTAGDGEVPQPRIHQPRLAEMGPPAVARPDTVGAHLAKGERRGDGTIWRANPREQGLIGLTDAIAWFGSRGWDVCLPLIDSQPYDLVVDDGERLRKVQVKTTTQRNGRGAFEVQLCTRGGNRSFTTTKYLDPSAFDVLYVLTDDGARYLVPAGRITARTSLTLNARFDDCRVSGC